MISEPVDESHPPNAKFFIILSNISEGLTVEILRTLMITFGAFDKVFLHMAPEEDDPITSYGMVYFMDRTVAEQVAQQRQLHFNGWRMTADLVEIQPNSGRGRVFRHRSHFFNKFIWKAEELKNLNEVSFPQINYLAMYYSSFQEKIKIGKEDKCEKKFKNPYTSMIRSTRKGTQQFFRDILNRGNDNYVFQKVENGFLRRV